MKTIFDRTVFLLSGIALALAGLALLDFLLHPLAGDAIFDSTLFRAVVTLVLIPLNLLAGFLIIRRVPGNIVGPLLIVWTATVAYFAVRDEISAWLFALYYWFDLAFGWLALFLVLLHFPDGTLYPPHVARWFYPYVALTVVIAQLRFFSQANLQVPSRLVNPYHLAILQSFDGLFLTLALLTIVPILVLALALPALRYRKGSHRERQQIKWLVLFGAANATYIILGLVALPLLTGSQAMDAGTGRFAPLIYFSAGLYPPLGIGVAILRHRLYDIDIIIRRTLVYSILSTVLAAIYFGGVVVVQQLFRAATGETPDLAIVVSTLFIALLFSPLRRRIQEAVDRRFYRRKYDAEQTLARFNHTLRDEVDIEALKAQLIGVVNETMQPAKVGLWVKE